MSSLELGSLVWHNWMLAREGAALCRITEHGLFTDATFAGISEHRATFGPCLLIGSSPAPSDDPSQPRAFLRIAHYTNPEDFKPSEAQSDQYHGGRIHDEIAALLSLEIGERMQAGPATRVIPANGDPLGEPTSFINIGQRVPRLPTPRGLKILPRMGTYVDIPRLDLARRFHELTPGQSVAVARACRLYQDAVWFAEAEPQIAWLLLVSAVEVGALEWGQGRFADSVANLRDTKPDLCSELESTVGHDALVIVARHYAETTGATKRFREFLTAFCPPPPERRSVAGTTVDWSTSSLRRAFNRIYRHRSKALHAGTPFPGILCLAPTAVDNVPLERPLATAIATLRTTWTSEDLPFHLHVFEYIVRASLLKWWRTLLPSGTPADAA